MVESSEVGDLRRELQAALDTMEGDRSHRAFDWMLAALSVETAMQEILVPYLHDLGDRWARGEVSVAQEHFASNLIRGRLMGLARDWAAGEGPSVVLACPPGEAHDLGLIMFGIEIARLGWRVTFLGADTPIETLADVIRALRPSLVVLPVEAGSAPEATRPRDPLAVGVRTCGHRRGGHAQAGRDPRRASVER